MQLILNTYGAYLRVKDGNFLVKAEDRKMELSHYQTAGKLSI